MIEKAGMALTLLATMVACSAAYLATIALAARVLRLGISDYVLGFGWVVARRGSFTLRWFPLTAHFLPVHRSSVLPTPPPVAAAVEQGHLRRYEELPFVLAIGLALLSAVVPFVGAGIVV